MMFVIAGAEEKRTEKAQERTEQTEKAEQTKDKEIKKGKEGETFFPFLTIEKGWVCFDSLQ